MDTIFKASPSNITIGPFGFYMNAVDFLFAARSFKVRAEFSLVPFFLYCRSIELVLKGFLLARGVPRDNLKKLLSHDLEKVLNKAREMGLDTYVTLIAKQEQEVRRANAYYKLKDFEYFPFIKTIRGYPDLPNLSLLEEIASLLVDKLQSPCENVD